MSYDSNSNTIVEMKVRKNKGSLQQQCDKGEKTRLR